MGGHQWPTAIRYVHDGKDKEGSKPRFLCYTAQPLDVPSPMGDPMIRYVFEDRFRHHQVAMAQVMQSCKQHPTTSETSYETIN